MEAITNKEEIRKIAVSEYPDDVSMQDYLVKSYLYFKTDSGNIWMYRKPGIDSTIYYNDECISPLADNKHDGFIKENMCNYDTDGLNIDRWQEEMESMRVNQVCAGGVMLHPIYESSTRRSNSEYKFVRPMFWSYGYAWDEEPRGEIISDKELQDISNIMSGLKAKYMKRLETYYKRYNKNIRACGYWANR